MEFVVFVLAEYGLTDCDELWAWGLLVGVVGIGHIWWWEYYNGEDGFAVDWWDFCYRLFLFLCSYVFTVVIFC